MSTNFTLPGRKRWALSLLLTAVALLLLMVFALYVLLATHPGNRWLLSAASRVEPRLAITLESGILLGEASLSNLSWSSPGLDIQIPQLEWRWDWQCLQDDTLCLDLLRTQGGSVTLTDAPAAGEISTAEDSGDLQLPFALEIRSLQLQQTRVDIYGDEIALAELQGAARFNGDGLQISTLELRDLQVAIAATPADTTEAVAGSAALVLPEINLPFAIQLDDFDLQTARIGLDKSEYLIHHLQLAAAAAGPKIELTRLALATPEVTLQAEGRINMSSDYPLELHANIELIELPPVTGLNIELTATGSVADLAVELAAQGPVTGVLSAHAALLDPILPFSAELAWRNFYWPIEQPTMSSEKGIAKIDGSLAGYSFTLSGEAEGEQLPELSLTANGQGDAEQIELTGLTLLTLDGEAELTGVLGWGEELIWTGELLLHKINPAELVIELPGRLNGRLESRLRWRDDNWELHLPKIAIEGELSGQPLRLHGSVQGNQSGDWLFTQLQLQSGRNSLQVDGQIGAKNKLTGKLEIADLQSSIAQATGSAAGAFNLFGQRDALQLDFSLTAQDLSHAGQMIGALEAGGELTLATTAQGAIRQRAIPSGSVQIQAEQIVYQDLAFEQLQAQFTGATDTQSLTLDLQGEKLSVQSSIEGRLHEHLWSGQLQPTRLQTPFGDWRLDDPLDLSYRIEQQLATIANHCWRSGSASLCLNEPAEIGKTGLLNISLQDFDSKQLTELMPDGFTWQGTLNANATAEWSPEQKPLIKADLTAGNGRFEIRQAGQTVQGDYQQLDLSASLDESSAQAKLLLRSDLLGQADITLQLPLDKEERTIQSKFHLSGLQLSILRPLLEPLDELAGTIDADGKISGSLQRPQINGKVVVHDGRLIDSNLPSDIEQVNLQLILEGYRANLGGDMLLGSGRAELAGAFTWEQQPTTGWLSLKGKRHRIRFEPELDLLISPDLRMDLQEKQLALTGTILIPYGRTRIRTLPQGAVRISDDVVILDKPKKNRAEQVLPLSLDVEVTLLDDVEIDAFGLKADLEGSLALKQSVNQSLTGNGSIDLREGTYRAFGQNLLINKGVLLFSGPLSKPYIDVDAIRNPNVTSDNVTAGIRIRGEAQKPKVTIYSEPAMSQQEAISYLLRGRSLGASSGSSQDTMVATMLIGAGIGTTEGTISELGQTFGIKEMAVDTSGEGTDTQVKVSGYVLPGVQVGYGVGVFSPITVISIRYEILPKLILEASNGLQSAADILYEFEF